MSSSLRSVVLAATAAAVLACDGTALTEVDGAGEPLETPVRTFYVSRLGDGSDGRTWQTAWSDFADIHWEELGPGDLVLIDGGASSMTYETTLVFGRSGEPRRPIVFRASDEEGRSGQIILNGGRSTVLPSCGDTDFQRPGAGEIRLNGIDTNKQSWVLVDGRRWGGMKLTAFGGPAITFDPDSTHLTFRNVEVSDNGTAAWRTDGTWYPFGAGVQLAGERMLLERFLVHDNGGDGLRIEGKTSNVVVRRSWLYNTRVHPTDADEAFNHCAEPAGLHVAPVGENQYGLTVEDSLVGPGFSTGLLLSDARVLAEWGVMNDVTLRHVTVLSHGGASASANIFAMQPPGHAPSDVRLEHVTSLRPTGAKLANVAIRGKGHRVTKSLFVGGGELFFEEPTVDGACRGSGVTGSAVGEIIDPLFEDADYAGLGPDAAAFDLSFDNRSGCQGYGSRITSVAVLMQEGPLPDAPAVVPNTAPTVSFLAPLVGAPAVAGEPIGVTVKAQDADGLITQVEFFADGSSIGVIALAPYTLAWTPTEGVNTLTAIATDDDGATAEAVVQVDATGKPSVEFEAESGTLSGAFTVTAEGCVAQTTSTMTVGTGGRAEYSFAVTVPGTYVLKGMVTAPSQGENSFFFNVDAEPNGMSIWDLGLTATPDEQMANWRGNGTIASPEYAPKTFLLTAGQHTLILMGREPNSCVDRFRIELAQ